MEFLTAYLVGVVALIGLWAVRIPHEDVRMVFLLGMFWPLTILLLIFTMALTLVGWEYDVIKGIKTFGFRRAGNEAVNGFALTVFGTEFQFWSVRKG